MQINNINTFLVELNKKKFSNQINLGSFLLMYEWKKIISLDYINYKYFNELNYFLNLQNLFFYNFSRLDNNEFIVYFSLNQKNLKTFKNKFEEYINWDNKNIIYIWKYLWFPNCCIKNFYIFFKYIKIQDIKYHMYDFIKNIYDKSDVFSKYLDIFKEKRLIFHTPCLFSCKYSIALWKNTNSILSNYTKDIYPYSYMYLFFETNDFIKLDKNWKYISEWVYYEYNEKADRNLFYKYKSYIISNWWFFNENIMNHNDKILYIKFN